VFYAGDTRSRAELENVGERFQGIINSDDVLSVYNGYPLLSKVFSHLRRRQKLIKFGRGVLATIGEVFLELIDEAFAQYRLWQKQDTAITNSGPMPSKCRCN